MVVNTAAAAVAAIAQLIRDHRETSGMRVSMGWTCRCGHWASGGRGDTREDHWAAVIVGSIEGTPSDEEAP